MPHFLRRHLTTPRSETAASAGTGSPGGRMGSWGSSACALLHDLPSRSGVLHTLQALLGSCVPKKQPSWGEAPPQPAGSPPALPEFEVVWQEAAHLAVLLSLENQLQQVLLAEVPVQDAAPEEQLPPGKHLLAEEVAW